MKENVLYDGLFCSQEQCRLLGLVPYGIAIHEIIESDFIPVYQNENKKSVIIFTDNTIFCDCHNKEVLNGIESLYTFSGDQRVFNEKLAELSEYVNNHNKGILKVENEVEAILTKGLEEVDINSIESVVENLQVKVVFCSGREKTYNSNDVYFCTSDEMSGNIDNSGDFPNNVKVLVNTQNIEEMELI